MCASRVDTITDPLKKIELFKALASPAFIGKTIMLLRIFYRSTVIWYFLLFYCYLVFSTVPPLQWPV